jgi:hypothetical protein
VFFVTKQQQGIIEHAIEKLDSCFRRNDKQSKAQRRAAAITAIAEHYLTGQNIVLNAENGGLQNKTALV